MSVLPDFLDALVLALSGRVALVEVNVASGPLGPEDEGTAAIVLADEAVTGAEEYDNIGDGSRAVSLTVPCHTFAWSTGKAETAIAAARDTAFSYLEEVRQEASENPTATASVSDWSVGSWSLEQGYDDNGRWAALKFVIEATAYTVPT